jgi:hypothetical protein
MPSYHIELRQFPRNFVRFNLTGPEVGAIALTWAQDKLLNYGDERWSPAEASIIIIEGPEIPVERLSMGRGWTTALREGQDVTDQVIGEARAEVRKAAAPAPANGHAAPGGGPAVDPLAFGVELAGLLGPEAGRLLASWRAVAARSSGLAPSESLALAERDLADGAGPDD